MAEITEVFDDAFDTIDKSVKKVSKSKTFWWIAGGVAIVALIGFFRKNNSATSEDTAMYATGYTGYPATVTGSSEDSGYYTESDVNSILESMQDGYEDVISDYEETISDHEKTIADLNVRNDEMASNISSLSDQLREAQNELLLSGTNNKEDEVIINNTDSTSGKTASTYDPNYMSNVNYQHLINEAILNGASGSTINQLNDARNTKIEVTGSSLEYANSSYDPDTDYTKLINQAKSAGASQAVIDNLTAQRNAKIMGEYDGIDPDTKKPVSNYSNTKTSSSGGLKSTTTTSTGSKISSVLANR